MSGRIRSAVSRQLAQLKTAVHTLCSVPGLPAADSHVITPIARATAPAQQRTDSRGSLSASKRYLVPAGAAASDAANDAALQQPGAVERKPADSPVLAPVQLARNATPNDDKTSAGSWLLLSDAHSAALGVGNVGNVNTTRDARDARDSSAAIAQAAPGTTSSPQLSPAEAEAQVMSLLQIGDLPSASGTAPFDLLRFELLTLFDEAMQSVKALMESNRCRRSVCTEFSPEIICVLQFSAVPQHGALPHPARRANAAI